MAEIPPLFATYGAEKPPGAVFDKQAAERAVVWIERRLRHFKGRWAGIPFLLMAWQRRLVGELFGWKRSEGGRLYRRAYVEAPRKSGKSSLASAIALYLAYGDGEAAPEVWLAAFDTEQARVCYDAARDMLEQSPELYAQTAVYTSRKEMVLRDNPGGFLRCLSRESAAQYGLSGQGKQRVTPIIKVTGGRVETGAEIDGEFVSSADLGPCCESPIDCHRNGLSSGLRMAVPWTSPSPFGTRDRPLLPSVQSELAFVGLNVLGADCVVNGILAVALRWVVVVW